MRLVFVYFQSQKRICPNDPLQWKSCLIMIKVLQYTFFINFYSTFYATILYRFNHKHFLPGVKIHSREYDENIRTCILYLKRRRSPFFRLWSHHFKEVPIGSKYILVTVVLWTKFLQIWRNRVPFVLAHCNPKNLYIQNKKTTMTNREILGSLIAQQKVKNMKLLRSLKEIHSWEAYKTADAHWQVPSLRKTSHK